MKVRRGLRFLGMLTLAVGIVVAAIASSFAFLLYLIYVPYVLRARTRAVARRRQRQEAREWYQRGREIERRIKVGKALG